MQFEISLATLLGIIANLLKLSTTDRRYQTTFTVHIEFNRNRMKYTTLREKFYFSTRLVVMPADFARDSPIRFKHHKVNGKASNHYTLLLRLDQKLYSANTNNTWLPVFTLLR